MQALAGALLAWAAALGAGMRPVAPVIEPQPLDQSSFVVLYTNDTRGYLEGCGCGGDNSGGLARRATLLASLRALYENVVTVDSGNVANRADVMGVAFGAMAQMGYDAVGVGILEAGIGADVLSAAKEAGVPLVGTVGPQAGQTAPGRLTKEVGGVTVGIVGMGWVSDPEAGAYRDQVGKLLSAAREESDFVIALSQLGPEADKQLFASAGLTDLADVVVGGPVLWSDDRPLFAGRTLLLPGSTKGREVGVLEVKLTNEGTLYHQEMVTVAAALPQDPDIAERINRYYQERQQRTGERPASSGGETADLPPLPDVFTADEAKAMRGRGYLTAEECGRCHADQLKEWQTTQHAHALQTLIGRDRAVDECLVCHSEASRRGLPHDAAGADRFGVDCAACHGAGLYHAAAKGAGETIVRAPTEALCRRCHTDERDARFAFDARVAKVRH